MYNPFPSNKRNPMPVMRARLGACMVAAAFVALSSGCGAIDERIRGALGAMAPYEVEVVQGNFLSEEQVGTLKPGMSHQQVRELLGTPLLMDIFHADRWDYVFTIRRQGIAARQLRLAVFFENDRFDRSVGDRMPSEREFIALLDSRGDRAPAPAASPPVRTENLSSP